MFSIDSLLQRKVVHHNGPQPINRSPNIDTICSKTEDNPLDQGRGLKIKGNHSIDSSSTPALSSSSAAAVGLPSMEKPLASLPPHPLLLASMLPNAPANPLESLTYENILKSASIQQKKKGK